MGKDSARVRLLLIDNNKGADESCTEVISSFQTVNLRQAKCSSPDDREKILVIIESSFSTLRGFDAHISKLLMQVCAPQTHGCRARVVICQRDRTCISLTLVATLCVLICRCTMRQRRGGLRASRSL
jgi:hypothetical protein